MSVLAILLFFIMITICASMVTIPFADAGEERPWGVERVRAHCVWDKDQNGEVDPNANGGQGISMAIIDTGVVYVDVDNRTRTYHPDLADSIAGGLGFDYQYDTDQVKIRESEYDDAIGHGTKMAGVIAAVDNDAGVINLSTPF